MRTYKPERMIEDLWEYREDLKLFDPHSWLNNYDNIALEEDGNYALFQHEGSGLYTGHYFFKVRGRKAINLGNKMLSHLFANFPATAVRGMTPLEKRPARWMARQLGFTSHGPIEYGNRWCELFILTEQEHKDKQ